MDVEARIRRCRLMEKIAERPEYAEKLGLRGRLIKKRGGPLPQNEGSPETEGADAERPVGKIPKDKAGRSKKI